MGGRSRRASRSSTTSSRTLANNWNACTRCRTVLTCQNHRPGDARLADREIVTVLLEHIQRVGGLTQRRRIGHQHTVGHDSQVRVDSDYCPRCRIGLMRRVALTAISPCPPDIPRKAGGAAQ